jgi:uncharacterized protein YhhL (DUF1145 family)
MSLILSHGLTYGILLGLLAVEYFYRIPLANIIRALTSVAHRALRILRSKNISDHWKEIVLLRYARELSTQTAALALVLAGCGVLVVVPASILDRVVAPSPSVLGAMTSVPGLILVTIAALVYAFLRSRFAKK